MHPGSTHPCHRCGLAAGLLGAVAYLATFIAIQVTGRDSHKDRERRWQPAIPMFTAATGLQVPSIDPAQYHSPSYSSPWRVCPLCCSRHSG